jgi:hypothetical protein
MIVNRKIIFIFNIQGILKMEIGNGKKTVLVAKFEYILIMGKICKIK